MLPRLRILLPRTMNIRLHVRTVIVVVRFRQNVYNIRANKKKRTANREEKDAGIGESFLAHILNRSECGDC